MSGWNLWHGCRKVSEGCRNCYVYRMDGAFDKDASVVSKTGAFDLPVRRKRDGSYKLTPDAGTVYTCFTSDFFLDEADLWRKEAWQMIRQRPDLRFFIITKRIERFGVSLPDDWGCGYDHVTIGSTTENQQSADYRLPIFLKLPIRHKVIICEPLLEDLDLTCYLESGCFEQLLVGGESGSRARLCRYEWVLHLREQCVATRTPFRFRQTGSCFCKDDRIYSIGRMLQHSQARKSGSDYDPPLCP